MIGVMFAKVLQLSLLSCYIFGIIWLVRLFLRKIGRKYCYYLWMILFLNLCIPVSVSGSFSLIPKMLQEQAMQMESRFDENDPPEKSMESEKILMLHHMNMTEYDRSVFETPVRETTGSAKDQEVAVQRKQFSWEQVLPWAEKVWVLGIFGFGLYSLSVSLRFQYRLKKSKKCNADRKTGIIEVNRLSSPFVWGIFSPKIYLPANMEEEERSYVLLHEEYHRKRKDHLVKFLLYGITIVYWFHPLVWIAYHLCCKDMEISCDEAVLEHSEKNIRKAYARSLLKFAAKQNHYVFTPLTFGEPSVRSRIESVLKYRKKGVFLSAVAVLLLIVTGVGLLSRPKTAHQKSLSEGKANTELSDSLKLTVANQGGQIIQIGSNLYYDEGSRLYSDGRYLYGTAVYEDGSPSAIYRHELDGSGFKRLAEGEIIGISSDRKELYCLSGKTSEEDSEELSVSVEAILLDTEEVCSLLVIDDVSLEQISCTYADEDGFLFSAGTYEGSAGYYQGAFYYADFEKQQIIENHLTDSDSFMVLDGQVYYQKYDNFGEGGNDLYRTTFALSDEELIAEEEELLAIDQEKKRLITKKENGMNLLSSDGKERVHLFDGAEAMETELMAEDWIKFTEVNAVRNEIFVKAERWRYVEGNGWRDSLQEEQYFKINMDGGEYQEWNPQQLVEEAEISEELENPIPGTPLSDLSFWDLSNVKDVRETFSQMSYIPKEGAENETYLLGKTEHYTLYGKGSQDKLLLESEGNYAQIQYPYTSNYMTPLELLETDLDKDGQQELAIKLNVKHGTGIYIDTFLLADFGKDGELYVYQFLEKDCTEQFQSHLSWEVNESGVQAKIDGKNAGRFLENEKGMDPYRSVTCGAQLRFYYENGEITVGAELQFLNNEAGEYGGYCGWNSNDITAVVNWDDGQFVLTDFCSRNREMEQMISEHLKEKYGAEIITAFEYDSSDMNQETMDVVVTFRKNGAGFHEKKTVRVKRMPIDAVSGWEFQEIL